MVLSDAELFAAWCKGDRSAGSALFDRHYDAVARFFHNKVDDGARGDLIQSTFLACVESAARFRGDSSFRTYLLSIAHNLVCKHYRDRRPAAVDLDLGETRVVDLVPSVSEVARAREEQRLLLAALRRVPIDCQEVLELHYWEQLTTQEIAAVVGVPHGTAKSRLQRGRRLLEEQLAALATSPALLESTKTGLDEWATELRDRLLPASSGSHRSLPG